MAIAFRSVSSLAYASGRTSSVVPPPAGLANGDTMVTQLILGGGGAPVASTPPAGWTRFGTDMTVNSGGFFARIETWSKRASSESGNYTWSHGNNSTAAWIASFTGAKVSGPLGATSTNSGLGSGGVTTATGLGITTTAANSWLLFCGFDWGDTTTNLTPPSGMTERQEQVILYLATELRAAAAATGNRTMNNNTVTVTSSWGVRMLELLEEPTATTGTYVKVAGVWKLADTQVKHQGTWKPAATFVKVAGVWKPAGT